MVLVAEDVMEREHARLRYHRGRIRGGVQREVDVPGSDLLRHLGLLAQRGAWKLTHCQRALADLVQLLRERVGEEAVGGVARLVVPERECASRSGPRVPWTRDQCKSERGGTTEKRSSGDH